LKVFLTSWSAIIHASSISSIFTKIAKFAREGANKSVVTQRVLKYVVARQVSQAMAIVLAKKPNTANAYFRARPTGLSAKQLFCVGLF